jgi:hypothetical protein
MLHHSPTSMALAHKIAAFCDRRYGKKNDPIRNYEKEDVSMIGKGTVLFVLSLLLFSISSWADDFRYLPNAGAVINPERGFASWVDVVSYSNMSFIRAKGNSLGFGYIRLDDFRDQPISAAYLNQISSGFQRVRQSGIKMVVGFSYNFAAGDPDASKFWIQYHLKQLEPILKDNADVIAVLWGGFIGAWGEWHNSTNGLLTPTIKREIVASILDALPQSRFVGIRYPHDLMELQDSIPITGDEGFKGSDAARLGSFQNCFLASDDDWGTWGTKVNPADPNGTSWIWLGTIDQDKSYVEANARYSPVGGETCNVNPPRTNCATAVSEMKRLQFSFLHDDYEPNVLAGFKEQGCYDTMKAYMGYRFVLDTASFPTKVQRGKRFQLNINLTNTGWANMYNYRPVNLVFSNKYYKYVIPLGEDPRRWAAGEKVAISKEIFLPSSMSVGTYNVSIWMPDDSLLIQSNPAYSVQFANAGTWDSATGFNILSKSVQITY